MEYDYMIWFSGIKSKSKSKSNLVH